MKTMFHRLLLAALLFMPLTVAAQLTVPGTSFTFALPEGEWRYVRTFELDNQASLYLFSYAGQLPVDAAGDTALPCLRVYVRKGYTGDLYQLAYERYLQQPYQSLRDYTRGPGLPRSGGIGYDAIYTNPSDGRDYRFLMTYFKERNTAVEFRLETTSGTWEAMKPVFESIQASIK